MGKKKPYYSPKMINKIKDDMAEILALIEGADVRVLATPLYCDNISGMLKVFVDRLIVTASLYWGRMKMGSAGICRQVHRRNWR